MFQDIDRLEKAFSQAPSSCGVSSALGTQTKQPLQIDASKTVSFTPASFLQNGVCSVVSMAVCQLGINPGVVSFEAHLDKLSLFPPGGYVEPLYVTEREPGKHFEIRYLGICLSSSKVHVYVWIQECLPASFCRSQLWVATLVEK